MREENLVDMQAWFESAPWYLEASFKVKEGMTLEQNAHVFSRQRPTNPASALWLLHANITEVGN